MEALKGHERPPSVAGRYRLDAELASGGMGTVFRAFDQSTQAAVALKRLHAGADHRVVDLFRREYYTLAQLEHPHILQVFDYGVDAGGAYYTMELLDGEDLRELAPLDVQQACLHLRDVASALALVHSRRLLHRDISPRNVRITADRRAKLIDFGALANFGPNTQLVGTPPGVPPEAMHRLDLDQRSDLYCFGALAYCVLTGRHAYPARALNQLPMLWHDGPPEPPSALVDGIPAALDDLVMSLLSLDMVGRPRTAGEVIDRLHQIADLPSEVVTAVGSSYLVNPHVVGRGRAMRRVRKVVSALRSEKAAGLLIRGPAGVGRSRLLAEAAMEAQLGGATVARVDAEMHRGPYGVLRELSSILCLQLPETVRRAAAPHAGVLGHALPELADHVGGRKLAAMPKDRAEHRLRVQRAALDFLRALAREAPIALTVDNAQAADESSLAALAAVLKDASGASVAVLLAVRDDDEVTAPAALGRLALGCRKVEIAGLSPDDTVALTRALFGEVDNAQRLGLWLYDRTGGNPTHCLGLAAALVDAGHIQYQEGAWVVPQELPTGFEKQGLQDLHAQQLARLSAGARRLTENLSVERSAIALGKCLALSQMNDEQAFAALNELVSQGILMVADDVYHFSHGALRDHAFGQLSPERRRRLHLQSAELTLKHGADDPMIQIDAGWHLMRGGQELRGANLLENASLSLVTTIEGLQFAAPALEEALAVYERTEQSPWVLLPVLDALTSAGWYVDLKYVHKHGERTLDLALELSGLRAAEKLAPLMGERRALKVGLAYAASKHALHKKHIRNKRLRKFKTLFSPLVGTVGILVGVAANTLDGAEARRVLHKARMLRAFEPGHALSVMYRYARYFTLTAEGRLGEALPLALQVLDWFESEEAANWLGKEGATALSGGILTGLATYAAFRDGDDVEQWASRQEALGLTFYAAMAVQARYVHLVVQGEVERARPYREQLEMHAIQGGNLWQSAVLLPIIQGGLAARVGDAAGLKPAIDALDRLAGDIPVMGHYAALYRAHRELLRGSPERALAHLEPALARVGPGQSTLGYDVAVLHGRVLLAQGEKARARVALAQARARLTPQDEPYVFLSLEVHMLAGALAEAEGDFEAAARLYDAEIAARAPARGPLSLCRLNEARGRVALVQADEECFGQCLRALDHWAQESQNPQLVAKAKRLQREGKRVFGRAGGSPVDGEAASTSMASSLRTLLVSKELDERAQAALRFAVERSGARAGFLYLGQNTTMELVCALPAVEAPPLEFGERLRSLLSGTMAGASSTATETATATASLDEVTTGARDLRTEFLLLPHAGGHRIVGALVLERDHEEPLCPLHMELLRTIAECCVY